ncbi:MAG: long-chain-fatty-acid--CoA ligase [Candidatus Methanofastidiosum methylothiophilum]|uniref:Long-chain-fatty-acid--CoA ligase n=1 Tax=Candidatus Methanofastidiosum methylothiophilum TaxID=1705564 RepID=A0A150J411_9EURY|nr:MAG: long-chain-fatty-acid--CoA ligase [Candidatus Methanofastidiosum methylthiophilus]
MIDPKTGEALSEGEEGELVLTSFTREALPVIRFRTGDIASIIEDKCDCGMPYRRISRIKGRVDDLLIIKGVNVYPSEIEHLLCNTPGIGNNYQIFVKEENGFHDLMVQVEGNISAVEIKKRIKENFLFTPEVEVLPNGSIPRNEGKAVRIIKNKEV